MTSSRQNVSFQKATKLKSIVIESAYYVILSLLNMGNESGAQYWIDGIPKSDDQELKSLTLE
jgi:hypothetical protein